MPEIRALVEQIVPGDSLEAEHRGSVLAWLEQTDDIFRRVKPRTPSQHLVAYFLMVDPRGPHILLVDHLKAGRWLPTGGHVEPGESPVETVRREVVEELGIVARFTDWQGERPLFVTVTPTVGEVDDRHTDVSLWFVLDGRRDQALRPDLSEFTSVRWWAVVDVGAADPLEFDPQLGRMLDKMMRSLPPATARRRGSAS